MRVEKPAGTLTAATTRTSYGCYVLNTQGVAFIYPTPTEIGRVQDFQQWDAQYNTHRTGFSVCEHFGPEAIGPDIAVLLELQDKWVLGTGPLA